VSKRNCSVNAILETEKPNLGALRYFQGGTGKGGRYGEGDRKKKKIKVKRLIYTDKDSKREKKSISRDRIAMKGGKSGNYK